MFWICRYVELWVSYPVKVWYTIDLLQSPCMGIFCGFGCFGFSGMWNYGFRGLLRVDII